MLKADFTAELHREGGGQVVVASPSLFSKKGKMFNPEGLVDDEGWLCIDAERDEYKFTRGEYRPIVFKFNYIKEEGKGVGKRTLYSISCKSGWEYDGARLERNARGWLGLYGTGVIGRITDAVTNYPLHLAGLGDYWKIETLQDWDGDLRSAEDVPFYLRDKHGHRVALATPDDAAVDLSTRHDRYLNAGETPGDILKFNLRNINLIE
ncbi:hypothetical protein [Pseudomonas sp. CM27]|uniref:hypothetical protein n=1 Tax=Pseudomonas sp. CM27 TaxID=2738452 RepID=UPI001552840A|nr:hypothetical protein [Pseudomonas sp. CM27]NQD77694.1 hypothetical protein [Pseudomonas sp. CM27]